MEKSRLQQRITAVQGMGAKTNKTNNWWVVKNLGKSNSMQIIVLIPIVIAFFNPGIGSVIFIVVSALLELWIILANLSKIKVKNEDNKYTPKEVEVIERYRLFFQYPTASRIISPMLSAIQLSAFILVPWLLFKGLYIQAVIIGANYFVASQLAVILNPQFFLHDNLDKGKIKDPIQLLRFKQDMNAIDSALEKQANKALRDDVKNHGKEAQDISLESVGIHDIEKQIFRQNELEEMETIVHDYAKVQESVSQDIPTKYPLLVYPESLLPYPKEKIRKALNDGIQYTQDEETRILLKGALDFLQGFINDKEANKRNSEILSNPGYREALNKNVKSND